MFAADVDGLDDDNGNGNGTGDNDDPEWVSILEQKSNVIPKWTNVDTFYLNCTNCMFQPKSTCQYGMWRMNGNRNIGHAGILFDRECGMYLCTLEHLNIVHCTLYMKSENWIISRFVFSPHSKCGEYKCSIAFSHECRFGDILAIRFLFGEPLNIAHFGHCALCEHSQFEQFLLIVFVDFLSNQSAALNCCHLKHIYIWVGRPYLKIFHIDLAVEFNLRCIQHNRPTIQSLAHSNDYYGTKCYL